MKVINSMHYTKALMTHFIYLFFLFCRHQVSEVIVTSANDSDYGLHVQIYVQSMGEVILQQVVIDAVNVRSSYYNSFNIIAP